MKLTYLLTILLGVVGLSSSTLLFADTTNGVASSSAQSLRVVVDPRLELMSVLFRLAGNPEYNQAGVKSYAEDVEQQFGKFRDHPAVKLARKVNQDRHVSYDAPMSLAVHWTEITNLQLKIPLRPWPEGLAPRWTKRDVNQLLKAARQFVEETHFQGFIEQHEALYQATAARMQAILEKEGHLEWFDSFFGQRPKASFTVAIGLLNGCGCYSTHFRASDGYEELFAIPGAGAADKQGLPIFGLYTVPVIVHEFCHSYCNPFVDRHFAQLRPSGEALFKPVSEKMRSQAYDNGQTLLCESLVRACVIRYQRRYGGEQVARDAIQMEKQNGFLWMEGLSDLLGDYETHRAQYPTFEDFSPRLIAFFAESAKKGGKP